MIHSKIFFLSSGCAAIAALLFCNFRFHQLRKAELEARAKLEYQAGHDALTGLLNRRSFNKILAEAIADKGGEYCLLMADLDDFKGVNDRLGHLAGDHLLIGFAEILNSLSLPATAARWAGDEFVLLIPGQLQDGLFAAELLREAVDGKSFAYNGQSFSTSVSVGIRQIEAVFESGDEAIAEADQALYEAKRRGKNRVYVWQQGLADEQLNQVRWYAEIELALKENRFYLDYQEICAIADEPDDLIEILLRMVLPDGSVVYPDNFIPFAERYGLIGKIDRWVVRWALNCACTSSQYTYFVNLSSQTLADPYFASFLSKLPLPQGRIVFEITETAAVQNLDQVKQLIYAAKLSGYQFALDDFGSGEASLNRLTELEGLIDYLKVDGYFAKNLLKSEDSIEYQLAQTTIRYACDVARMIGAKAIAEFVENQAILNKLRELHCDYGQGWGIGSGSGEFPGKPTRIWWCAVLLAL